MTSWIDDLPEINVFLGGAVKVSLCVSALSVKQTVEHFWTHFLCCILSAFTDNQWTHLWFHGCWQKLVTCSHAHKLSEMFTFVGKKLISLRQIKKKLVKHTWDIPLLHGSRSIVYRGSRCWSIVCPPALLSGAAMHIRPATIKNTITAAEFLLHF